MREHREGRVTLRTHQVEPIALPTLEPDVVRETREALNMSRQVFAFKLGVNPRTLERWEQGRSKPNEQAARAHLARAEVPGYLEAAGVSKRLGVRWLEATPQSGDIGCDP